MTPLDEGEDEADGKKKGEDQGRVNDGVYI